MPVRTAYVATEAVGDVLTKANFDKLPGGWIGYAEVTANQTTITAAVDLTGLTVTVTVNTSRRIRVTGSAELVNNTAGAGLLLLILADGAQVMSAPTGGMTANVAVRKVAQVVLTPTAGSHVYKLQAQTQVGGTGTMNAAATYPAFILVEDLGPAS
jgi:hypothetical protein